MDKLVITETNLVTRHGFQVITTTRLVPDSGIRMTVPLQIKKKRDKISQFAKQRDLTFRLIQQHQLLALTVESDYKAREALEYIDMILKPKMFKINQEITALEHQIKKLEARL